jgi:putative DNA primase/helicase
MFGDYGANMNPSSLAMKANTDSRTASGDIARLKGVRFLNVSEPPKKMIFDVALLKTLVGRDTITARHLHEREFEFIPEFKLVINTNHLPLILDDTVFSSGRIKVITFDRHYEDSEQDKDLKNKLKKPEEISGILNWCIRGLELYRQEGLKLPQSVISATEAYRQQSDKIGNFIDEMLVETGKNSKAKDVYDAYNKWCNSNGFGAENKSNFLDEMRNRNLLLKTGTVEGKTTKNVIKGYEVFESADDEPFS